LTERTTAGGCEGIRRADRLSIAAAVGRYRWHMEVLRLHGAQDVRIHQEPEPVAAPGEELVRITAVGLCGSDLHWYEDGGIGEAVVEEPLVLGHEMGGVIMSGPREGERVIVEPADPCGHCEVCRAGDGNLCPDVRFCGHAPIHGGLRALMTWPQRLLLPAPDSIGGDDIALVEPLGIALHGIDLGHFRAGMSAGVFGSGPIGLFLIRALKAMGAGRVIATDAKPHRVAAALASGADEAYLTAVDGQPAAIDDLAKIDVGFEAAGEDAALESALITVRLGGRVVVVGIPPTNRHAFPAKLARGKGLTIAWSRRMKAIHMLRAIEMADHGIVSLDGMITATYPLAEAAQAFDDLVTRRGLKVIVKPTE
jgi:L-iditol 2-dehydrogenase